MTKLSTNQLNGFSPLKKVVLFKLYLFDEQHLMQIVDRPEGNFSIFQFNLKSASVFFVYVPQNKRQ